MLTGSSKLTLDRFRSTGPISIYGSDITLRNGLETSATSGNGILVKDGDHRLSRDQDIALLINDPKLIERAEIIWQKGTNRKAFARGEVSKYTWVDVGSSYLPGELIAAFLLAQLEEAQAITARRLRIWIS